MGRPPVGLAVSHLSYRKEKWPRLTGPFVLTASRRFSGGDGGDDGDDGDGAPVHSELRKPRTQQRRWRPKRKQTSS